MITKAQKFRFGIFIVIGFFLILVLIGLVVGNKITENFDAYYIEFQDESVNGLQIGGSVKYHGIKIGTVKSISISEEDISKIIVEISVEEGTPIKEDVEATLAMVGITGLMQIELLGGTNETNTIKPGGKIPVGKSLISNITGKADVIATKVEILLNNLNEFLSDDNKENFSQLLVNSNHLIEDNSGSISKTFKNIEKISKNVDNLTSESKKSIALLNEYLESKELKSLLANASKISDDLSKAKIDSLMVNINSSISNFNRLIKDVDYTVIKSREDIFDSVDLMKETLDYLKEFSRIISENPSSIIRSSNK